jgi:1,4-dihydroxy-6-naphthoate synthase
MRNRMSMRLTVGHTPDADDAFMFYAITNNKVRLEDVYIEHVIEDIETLNRMAINNEIDVTAISAHAYAYTKDYVILRSGASFGLSYGPILVSRSDTTHKDIVARLEEDRCTIAVPGRLTTAYLLLRLALKGYRFNTVEARFDTIEDLVLDGKMDLGLIIHEVQLTFKEKGLVKFMDLYEYWSRVSDGLPLPLGIDVASMRIGKDNIVKVNNMLKRSILYAYEHFDDALDYAMQYSRGKDRDTIARFVKMYVNDLTIDMDKIGYNALRMLYSLAYKDGITDREVEPAVV